MQSMQKIIWKRPRQNGLLKAEIEERIVALSGKQSGAEGEQQQVQRGTNPQNRGLSRFGKIADLISEPPLSLIHI